MRRFYIFGQWLSLVIVGANLGLALALKAAPWAIAIYGFGFGLLVGINLHSIVRQFSRRGLHPIEREILEAMEHGGGHFVHVEPPVMVRKENKDEPIVH